MLWKRWSSCNVIGQKYKVGAIFVSHHRVPSHTEFAFYAVFLVTSEVTVSEKMLAEVPGLNEATYSGVRHRTLSFSF